MQAPPPLPPQATPPQMYPPRQPQSALPIILIVVGVVLATMLLFAVIVGLIAGPRILAASRRAKEATLRGNLYRIRAAVSQYYGDTGKWPARFEDIVAPTGSTPTGTTPGYYKGPYLTPAGGIANCGIPMNPYGPPTGALAEHWTYDATTGSVISAVSGTTMDGVAYTDL